MYPWKTRTIVLVLFLILLSACGADAPAETPPTESPPTLAPAEPTNPPIEDPLPTLDLSAPTAAVQIPDLHTAPEASIPDAPLSSRGPWLTIVAGDGIWAANPDGSGLTHLLDVELDSWFAESAVISPRSGLVAFLNGTDRYFDLSLTVYSIPERRVLRTIPLTTEETEPVRDVVLNDDMEPVRAISDFGSYAFSPDGSMLGFMGVIEGDSSDLYVYNIEADTITQLTDGPSQGFEVHWSPGSEYIFHFGAEGFGTGAGYVMDGAWAARADEGGILSPYVPPEQGAEEFVGWLNERTILVNSWNMHCGSVNLRSINIQTGDVRILWADTFSDIRFDEESGTLAIAVGDDYEGCNPTGRLGVFIIPLDGSPPRQMLEGEIRYFVLNEMSSDLVAIDEDGQPIQILPDGRLVHLNAPPQDFGYTRPQISPDGQWIAWPSDQFRVGGREPGGAAVPEVVLAERTSSAVWSPDSSAVFFFTSNGLHIAYAPDFIPLQALESGVLNYASVFWLQP